MTHIDVCKHGTFTGDPYGPDYLCGACECGDPDPTIREVMHEIQVELGYYDRAISRILEDKETSAHLVDLWIDDLDRKHDLELKRLAGKLAGIHRWTVELDDDDWMEKRYHHWLDEAERADREHEEREAERRAERMKEFLDEEFTY